MKIKDKEVQSAKRTIRNRILEVLRIQKEEDRNRKSCLIWKKLLRSEVFKKAKNVMFFISIGGEVNTKDMIREAQNLGKNIFVPVCGKNRMLKACFIGKDTVLCKGIYGTREPVVKKAADPRKIELVLVPGVAFTKDGKRLGRGKGYYDRFLEKLPSKTPSLGLAFDFQILPSIPVLPTDMTVDKVIFA